MHLRKITIPIRLQLPDTIKSIGKEEYKTELRIHPLLTWFWAAISTARAEYKPYIVPEGLLKELFTPRVHYFSNPSEFAPSDPLYNQLRINDAVCFPNLWQWTKMAVCRITGDTEESVLLKDIKINQFYDAFRCAQQFFQIHHNNTPNDAFFPTINMNFLRPSAASVLHPHFQSLILPLAPPLLALILQESKNYYETNHQDFFNAYAEHERNGPRWIGEVGHNEDRIFWISPWAPLAGSDEVLFISNSFSAFPLPDQVWRNIAEGLHKIFVGYHEMGIYSINLVIFSDVYNSTNEYFRIFGMIWSRPLKNLDISDRGFAELGYKMTLTFRSPEMVAADLRKYW